MHSPSLRQTKRKPATAAPVPAAELPAHLNFTFPDWFRQRTQLPRMPQGWSPADRLYADYLEWCAANDAPPEYVLQLSLFDDLLRESCARLPEMRKVQEGSLVRYTRCYPRHLIPAIRIAS